MAGKGSGFANSLLALLFQNTALAGIGDAGGLQPSVGTGSLYISLHTADPGPGGNQGTSEIAYTGYGRVALARTSGAWTITGNTVDPVANILFGAMSGGAGGTVTYWAMGTALSGAGILLYSGQVSPNIVVVTGVTPELTTGSMLTEN